MEEVAPGIARVTLPLPGRLDHVHAYVAAGADGATVVDTGLGLPDAKERWAAALHGTRVGRIVVTHFHPDHVGAARDLHELTGAPVLQGALDYAQCELVWGNPAWPGRVDAWFERAGVPAPVTDELADAADVYRRQVRYQVDPVLVEPGEVIDGWELVPAAGHADGQLLLLRDGVLLSADHLLPRITPAIGLWPASRPDPLGDYLEALERTVELAPRLALPGHGDPIRDPARRARELIEHHRRRLDATAAALGAEPRSGYDLSLALFGAELPPAARRFAVTETLSHLERLVREGRAVRPETGGMLAYTAA